MICTSFWTFVDQICCDVYVSTILSCVIPQMMNFFQLVSYIYRLIM
jgi:hypothetical protein